MTYEEFCEIWDGLEESLYNPPIDCPGNARRAIECGNYADELTSNQIEALEKFASENGTYRLEYRYCNDCDKIINDYHGHVHCEDCAGIFKSLEDCDLCSDCCNDNHNHCPMCNKNVDQTCEHCNNCVDHNCCECSICQDCDRLEECSECNRCERHCDCNNEVGEEINYGEPWIAKSIKDRKEFNCSRLAGVEWEFNAANNGEKPIVDWSKQWRSGIHDDNSCGRECVTAPISGDYISKCLTELSQAFDTSGALVDSSCSVHVHVDVSDYCWSDMINLLSIYSRLEPLLYLLGGQQRVNNDFCSPVGKEFGEALSNKTALVKGKRISNSRNLQAVKSKIMEIAYGCSNFDDAFNKPFYKHCKTYTQSLIHSRHMQGIKKAEGRYRGLNIIPFLVGKKRKAKDTTVEFRIHRDILDVKRVIGWTQLLVTIVDWCSKASLTDIEKLPSRDLQALFKIAPNSREYILTRLKDWRNSTSFKKASYPRRIKFGTNGKTMIVKDR